MPELLFEMKTALLSDDNVYRYGLFRGWDRGAGNALFIMLNPSTADAVMDDPTVRRCISYARGWGYGSLSVVNLYGLRATDPTDLAKHPEPIGPNNDMHILGHAVMADLIVCAWGNHGTPRSQTVVDMLLANMNHLHCLGVNLTGEPVHPLYQKANLQPQPFFRP